MLGLVFIGQRDTRHMQHGDHATNGVGLEVQLPAKTLDAAAAEEKPEPETATTLRLQGPVSHSAEVTFRSLAGWPTMALC